MAAKAIMIMGVSKSIGDTVYVVSSDRRDKPVTAKIIRVGVKYYYIERYKGDQGSKVGLESHVVRSGFGGYKTVYPAKSYHDQELYAERLKQKIRDSFGWGSGMSLTAKQLENACNALDIEYDKETFEHEK